MDTKKLILGTAGYTVCTFSLAVGWHVLLFQERYESFGYFEGEPDFLLGLLTIVLQGVLLSALFPMLKAEGTTFRRGIRFALITGACFWTSHVLAFVAKQEVPGVCRVRRDGNGLSAAPVRGVRVDHRLRPPGRGPGSASRWVRRGFATLSVAVPA